jgi:hypothetical protein
MSLKDFRSVHLPYCLTRQSDGRYVVLNREYKPLGFQTEEFVKYEDYPIAVKIKGLTPLKASKLSCKGSSDIDNIFLYNDGCIPTRSPAFMKTYLDRLAILAKLNFEWGRPSA